MTRIWLIHSAGTVQFVLAFQGNLARPSFTKLQKLVFPLFSSCRFQGSVSTSRSDRYGCYAMKEDRGDGVAVQ